MIKIEEAREEHVDDILGLFITACNELDTPFVPTVGTVKEGINRAAAGEDFGRIMTLEGVVVGILQLTTLKDFGFIQHFYVHPEFRGSLSAIKMLRQGEAWAKEKGCVEILMGGMYSVGTEHAKSLGYTKQYKLHGRRL
jgi:GNAT superfamily N-acetyltransferase